MEKINLVVWNGTAFVWNVEDWLKTRKFRILGNFIGSLAALPRQDQLAGLPLALLEEETTLLLEKNQAVTKIIPNITNPPNERIQEKYNEFIKKLFLEQAELLKEKRKQEIESKIDLILEGKKAKRKSPGEELSKELVLEEEFKKLQPLKPSSLAVQTCTGDPWLEVDDYKEYTWNYPKNDLEYLHYSVFKDLWEKGYYITHGEKFGGDYLAYPGDPIKFHAFFIVICIDKMKKLKMNDIIVYGRLGQSVRKTVILAYLNDNDVCYQSIQWSGF